MAITIIYTAAQAQLHKGSCCSASGATGTFASLADANGFSKAHASPVEIQYAAKGSMITFPTADGKTGSAYFIPSPGKSNKYIFVFQEWWGLNDYIKRQSDLYADSLKDVNVLAIDLYDGKSTTQADEAGKLMQAADESRIRNIIAGAYSHVGKDAKVATVGWCFGGGWSMQAALMGGKQLKACVMYYGMPETDVTRLKTLHSDVIFIFAKKDQWINEGVKNDFVKNMKAAGKTLVVKEYDADHAFANPSNPHFNKEFAQDAQAVTLRAFKAAFR